MKQDGGHNKKDLLRVSEKAVDELVNVSKALSRGAEVSQSETTKGIAEKTSAAVKAAVDLTVAHSFAQSKSIGLGLGNSSSDYKEDEENKDE
jgi:hypothetical protein